MFRHLLLLLLVSVSASALQQSCTAKAKDCKDPVTNPKHYEDRHCTCFTCQSGTSKQKVLCTNDENEAGKLQARIETPEKTLAQHKQEQQGIGAREEGKSLSLIGWVKEQDGKTVFVNDKDKQAWNIENTDAVKGHEGHRVKVKATLNEADHSLKIENLSMLPKSKHAGEEPETGRSSKAL